MRSKRSGMRGKLYRIGEAAALLHLKTYVLRFWEMEFPQITPLRTEKGQRLYTEKNLAMLRRIRYLLHERCLTIEGARRILAEEAARETLPNQEETPPQLDPPTESRNAAAPDQKPAARPSEQPAENFSLDEESEVLYRRLAAELESISSLLHSLDGPDQTTGPA